MSVDVFVWLYVSIWVNYYKYECIIPQVCPSDLFSGALSFLFSVSKKKIHVPSSCPSIENKHSPLTLIIFYKTSPPWSDTNYPCHFQKRKTNAYKSLFNSGYASTRCFRPIAFLYWNKYMQYHRVTCFSWFMLRFRNPWQLRLSLYDPLAIIPQTCSPL